MPQQKDYHNNVGDSLPEEPHTLHALTGLKYVVSNRVVPYDNNTTSKEKAICRLPQEDTKQA
jgi:hypothetical protein